MGSARSVLFKGELFLSLVETKIKVSRFFFVFQGVTHFIHFRVPLYSNLLYFFPLYIRIILMYCMLQGRLALCACTHRFISAVKGKRLMAASEKAKENEILNVSGVTEIMHVHMYGITIVEPRPRPRPRPYEPECPGLWCPEQSEGGS